jgi:Ion channel
MFRQFLVGSGVSICNIAIHALVMTAVVAVAQKAAERPTAHPVLLLISVMIAVVSVLMAAHVCEVLVWSLAYGIADAAPAGADLVYFAFVNYTTLGYGDVTPVPAWRLLGPFTAMNGVLLFGWSTAVIFEVLRRAMALRPLRRAPSPFDEAIEHSTLDVQNKSMAPQEDRQGIGPSRERAEHRGDT